MPQDTTGFEGPYAPLPSSVTATNLSFGSWFQTRPKLAQALAIVAGGTGIYYLTWRIVVTLPNANPFFFWLLFSAELFGFITYAIHVVEAWEIPATPRLAPLDVPVDILITTFNEDADVVLPTILGAMLVRGNTTVWLCDDGRRPEFEKLAKTHGIRYHTRPDNKDAKAGNINSVLPKLEGDLILVLDADHVPSPDFLEATSGYFAQTKIAIVQSAHSFRNHNSVMHSEKGRHEQSMFFDVLLPGRNRLNSAFWCGSAALIRRSALLEVGGMATYTSTEDFETSLKLQVAGYQIRYHNEHLIQGLAPDNLESYTIQRFRWAEGYLSSFAKGRRLALHKNLSWGQKMSYIGGVLYYLTPIQRLIYSFLLFSVAIFGVHPFGVLTKDFLAVWGTWALLSLVAGAALDRGVSSPFESIRNAFIIFEACLKALPAMWVKRPMKFHVTPKNEVDLGGWRVIRILAWPLALYSLMVGALIVRWIDIALAQSGSACLPPISNDSILVGTLFVAFEASILVAATVKYFRRRQYRHLWRFPVTLRASLDGVAVQAVDLHQGGMGLDVSSEAAGNLHLGDTLPVWVECRRLNGDNQSAEGTFEVRHLASGISMGNTLRIGGTMKWDAEASKEAVIEHCYVVEPYLARNRAWSRLSPRVKVSLPATIAGRPARVIDLSLAGAALVAKRSSAKVGDVIPLKVSLDSHEMVIGKIQVRNVSKLKNGDIRLGGLAYWENTTWMQDLAPMVLEPVA